MIPMPAIASVPQPAKITSLPGDFIVQTANFAAVGPESPENSHPHSGQN